jgi:ABC-type sugar transport system permease subunit
VALTTARMRGGAATNTPSRAKGRRPATSPAFRHDARLAWVLVAPAAVGFLVFAAYPLLRGIYLSFTDYRVLSPPKWTGLDNLRTLVSDDTFWSSLLTTLYFVLLSVVAGLLFSVITAVVLHRLTNSVVIRGIIILPFLISGVVAALIWSWMMDGQLGIINVVLAKLIGHPILFLGSSGWAIPAIAMISVWKSLGYHAILIFAGLQTVPPEIYEAGRIDGASELQMFRSLTLPLLRPILGMVVILTVVGSFQVFDIVSVTTKGGPANASNVLQMYIYDKAFNQFDFGYGATMSLALFILTLIITALQLRVFRADKSDLG